jgi:hypothetical protein
MNHLEMKEKLYEFPAPEPLNTEIMRKPVKIIIADTEIKKKKDEKKMNKFTVW